MSKINEDKVNLRVQEIIDYCETYKEWPKQFRNPQNDQEKESLKSALWLDHNHFISSTHPFRYEGINFKQTGLSVKSVLQELFDKYGKNSRRSLKYILNLVKEVEKYCETYNQFPMKSKSKDPIKKEGNRLAKWLYECGYNVENKKFKYSDLKDESGRKIETILNNLVDKYGQFKKGNSKTIQNYLLLIKKYTETYNEWPIYYRNPRNNQEKAANKLYNWLCKSYFYNPSKAFKYSNVKTPDGNLIIDELNKLYHEYHNSKEEVEQKVKEIQEFCLATKTWPVEYAEITTEKEAKSHELAVWLKKSNFYNFKKPYRYNMVMTNGENSFEVLTKLYQKYFSLEYKKALLKTEEIKEFCLTYNKWPEYYVKPVNEEQTKAQTLEKWLRKCNFYRLDNTFKYRTLKNQDDEFIYDILKQLYQKYYITQKEVFAKVEEIRDFCVTYKEWPQKHANPSNLEEYKANELASWLEKSNYKNGIEPFIYAYVTDKNGLSVQTILDTYYYLHSKNNLENDLNILNIWQAKDSQIPYISLYYYIINLSKYMNNNLELYNYYYTLLENKIKMSHLAITVDEIISDLTLSINEQVVVYYEKYLKYSQNLDLNLARLYYELYQYSYLMNKEVTSERQK